MTNAAFPRREISTEIYNRGDISGELANPYHAPNSIAVRELLANRRFYYKVTELDFSGAPVITEEKIQVGSICYDLKTRQRSNEYCIKSVGVIAPQVEKIEYFLDKTTLDSKPVKVFRMVSTYKVYKVGDATKGEETRVYIDSAGKLLGIQRFDIIKGQSALQFSKDYEYDVKIEPINLPVQKKTPRKSVKRH